MAIISTRVWNASQSWNFQRTVKTPIGVYRITIERNAYDGQSSGQVERWDSNQWQGVVRTPIEFLVCRQLSYVVKGITATHFEADCTTLLAEAMTIVKAGAY